MAVGVDDYLGYAKSIDVIGKVDSCHHLGAMSRVFHESFGEWIILCPVEHDFGICLSFLIRPAKAAVF